RCVSRVPGAARGVCARWRARSGASSDADHRDSRDAPGRSAVSGPEDLRHFLNEARLDRDNPWPGLASYDEASHEFFSGRSAETAELLRRILDEQVTVLFGKSGLGKTSLLKAGVFPRLRERDLLPIIIRMQIRTGGEPLIEQVRLALFDELR